MKTSRALSSITLLLFGFLTSSHAQCFTSDDMVISEDKEKHLSDARFNFALESLKHIAEIEPLDNIFYSPLSLHEALGLAYFGARKNTEASLKRALQIPENFSKLDLARFYNMKKSLVLSHKENSTGKDYDYRVANRLFLSNSIKLRECMLDFFDEELKQTDFKSDPSAAREAINEWVSNVTMNNIKNFLPSTAVDENTDAVLANAVYFKGLWQSKFNPEFTKKDVFYLGQHNMTFAEYMQQNGSFNYMASEELGVHILQLPYKGEDVSMYILLPPYVSTSSKNRSVDQPKSDGIRQLLHRISDPSGKNAKEFREILDNDMLAREVRLTIPKFSMERELPTKDLLVAMGADAVFDMHSDFGGFTADGEKTIHLGDALHRAKIELTEDGTTAAAATAVFSFRSSRPTEPVNFTANYPFAYFIYDRPSRDVLFAGIFRKPNKKYSE